jgi:hypothetical protein
MSECCFRGKWKKEFKTQIYGCSYYNEPNRVSFREVCPYKDVDIRKCEKYKERRIESDEEI